VKCCFAKFRTGRPNLLGAEHFYIFSYFISSRTVVFCLVTNRPVVWRVARSGAEISSLPCNHNRSFLSRSVLFGKAMSCFVPLSALWLGALHFLRSHAIILSSYPVRSSSVSYSSVEYNFVQGALINFRAPFLLCVKYTKIHEAL